MRVWTTVALSIAVALAVGVASATASGGNFANAKACQKGGWQTLAESGGRPFANEGACVNYGAMGGTLTQLTGLAALPPCMLPAPSNGFDLCAKTPAPDQSPLLGGAESPCPPGLQGRCVYVIGGAFNPSPLLGDGPDPCIFVIGGSTDPDSFGLSVWAVGAPCPNSRDWAAPAPG